MNRRGRHDGGLVLICPLPARKLSCLPCRHSRSAALQPVAALANLAGDRPCAARFRVDAAICEEARRATNDAFRPMSSYVFAKPTNRFSPYSGEVDPTDYDLMPMPPQTSAMSPVKTSEPANWPVSGAPRVGFDAARGLARWLWAIPPVSIWRSTGTGAALSQAAWRASRSPLREHWSRICREGGHEL